MDSKNIIKQYNNLYLKLMYNKKIFSKFSKEELNKIELDIYDNKKDIDKINYEIENIFNYVQKLDIDNENYILYKKLMVAINIELKKEKIDYSKVRNLITLCQLLLNLDFGFYNTFEKIDFVEIMNDVEKIFVLEKRDF